jgi:hypothetical protein
MIWLIGKTRAYRKDTRRRLSTAPFGAIVPAQPAAEGLVKKSVLYSVATIVTAIAFAIPPAGVAGAAERAARAPSVLPPHEIITIVRSTGLNPVSRPARQGMNYLLRAIDEGGQEVRVVVDGRIGEVIAVTPVAYGGREIDPMRPSVYDSGPPVYEVGPPVNRAAPPTIIEDEPEPPVYRRAAPVVPAPIVLPPREREVIIIPPPSAPDVIVVPPAPWAPPSSVAVAPPETDDTELLPPPPPRFPQRVITTPNTKPAPKIAAKPTKSAANPPAAKSNARVPANKQAARPSADAKFAPQAPAQ